MSWASILTKRLTTRLRGVSRMASFEIILERYHGEPMTEAQKEACCTKKNDLYRELLKNMSPADLSDEVKNTLDGLRAKGLKLAIGSSSRIPPSSSVSWVWVIILTLFIPTATTSPSPNPTPKSS